MRKPTLGGIARITGRAGGLLRIKDADERMAVENAATLELARRLIGCLRMSGPSPHQGWVPPSQSR
jgi:hypothetical protein